MHKVYNLLADSYNRKVMDDLLELTGYAIVRSPNDAELILLDDSVGHSIIKIVAESPSCVEGLRNSKLDMALSIYRAATDICHLRKNGYKGKICLFTSSILKPAFVQEKLAKVGVDYVMDVPDHPIKFLQQEMPLMFLDYGSVH